METKIEAREELSESYTKFKDQYVAQKEVVREAKVDLGVKGIELEGKTDEAWKTATVDVDDAKWAEFNKEYMKLRRIEFEAMTKVPEFVEFRTKVKAVKGTDEMKTMLVHWKQVTQQYQHQVVVHSQAKLIMAALKCLKMSKEDEEKFASPQKNAVMFEAFHALYIYFIAVGEGNLDPMFNFMIDGEYDEKFVKEVKADFGTPSEAPAAPESLYLY